MSPVTVAACLYLKCLAELSPGDMLLSERIIHPPQALPPPAWTLFVPAGVKTGSAFVCKALVPLPTSPRLDPLQACQDSPRSGLGGVQG